MNRKNRLKMNIKKQSNTSKEDLYNLHLDVIEIFFKNMQSILYTKVPLKAKQKMLYTARSEAEYLVGILACLTENFEEKSSNKNSPISP